MKTRESRRRKKKESKNSHKDSSTPIEDLKSKRDQLIVKLQEIKKQDRRTSYGTGKGTTKKKLEEEIEHYNGIIQKREEERDKYTAKYTKISQVEKENVTYSINMASLSGTRLTREQQQGTLRSVLMVGMMDMHIFTFALARFMGVDRIDHPVKDAFDTARIEELSMFLTMTRKDMTQLKQGSGTALSLGDTTQVCVACDMINIICY